MKKWKVTDTITFERTYYIPAIDADKAIAIANSGAVDPDEEEQIDNTPWDAEEIFELATPRWFASSRAAEEYAATLKYWVISHPHIGRWRVEELKEAYP